MCSMYHYSVQATEPFLEPYSKLRPTPPIVVSTQEVAEKIEGESFYGF